MLKQSHSSHNQVTTIFMELSVRMDCHYFFPPNSTYLGLLLYLLFIYETIYHG